MEPNALFKLTEENFPGVKFNSTEQSSITEAWGEWNGHALRFEFKDTPGDGAYRYNVLVYDAETGELITLGNGDRNWPDAFSIVQWQKLEHHWD